MSTRSYIMLQDGDVLKGIYCHNDGYLSHNGVILQKAYQDLDKVKKLISLGDLSALGENLEPFAGWEKYGWDFGVDNARKRQLFAQLSEKTQNHLWHEADKYTSAYWRDRYAKMARSKNNPAWFNNYSKKDFEALTYHIKPGEDAFETLQRLTDDDYTTNMIEYFYIFKPDSTGKYYWYVFDGETYCLLSEALKKENN